MEHSEFKSFFNREKFRAHLDTIEEWDVIIIGGGATGLGAAIDAASRGFKTLLMEQADFAKGTSSRSTKLVHGGVRYLAQGDVALVLEALRERGYLLKNAPHIVKKQAFIIPCFDWKAQWKYLAGLKLYDWMAGRFRFGKSIWMNRGAVLNMLPGLKSVGLQGGVEYYDGQFDDARLAVNMAQTAAENGGVLLNYVKVKALTKGNDGRVNGVIAYDLEGEREYSLRSKAVVNATGVFVDEVLNMDTPVRKQLVRPSQGVHLVLDKSFLEGEKALMIPKTSDGRVLFAVPWHDRILLGTTDTPVGQCSAEPRALDEEVDFILTTAGKYLARHPRREDVLSVFAGLRPLAASEKNENSTKEISRSHKLFVSSSNLITITGGKWTTYRQMAEDTINKAIEITGLPKAGCHTHHLKIHGFVEENGDSFLSVYGSDRQNIETLIAENAQLGETLHPRLPYVQAEVIWAVRNEMARTVEDVLARRLRALFLDARAAIDMAPTVASVMAKELKYGVEWQLQQVDAFQAVARHYLLEPYPLKSFISSDTQLVTE